MHIKRKLTLLFFVIVLIIILAIYLISIIFNDVTPVIVEYSKSEMKKIAATVINKAITNDIVEEMDLNQLFIIEKDNDNDVIMVMLDPSIINRASSKATDSVEDSLKRIELKDPKALEDFNINEDCFYVPTGLAFNSPFLNNIGPKIPISLKLVGNVTSGIVTEVKEYGINNSLITISMEISVEIQVILPFVTDYVSITNYVPLVIKLIQGKVPVYYGDGFLFNNSHNNLNN